MTKRKFIHYFDVVIRKQFESNIADFDSAFDAWAAGFPTEDHLRDELLESETTKSIVDNLVHVETDEQEVE